MRSWLTAVVVGCGVAAASAGVRAEDEIFYWVDRKGNVHVTDRLGDVPEPYYSMYAAQQREQRQQRERRAAAGAPEPQAPPLPAPRPAPAPRARGPSVVEQELARQRYWRGLVARWRSELEEATAQVRRIQSQIESTQLNNPLLRYTPQVDGRLRDLRQQLLQARERVEKARQMLLEELPRRARQENVPPRWLE